MLSTKKLLYKICSWMSVPLVETREVVGTISVNGNSNASYQFTAPTVSGYKYCGIVGIQSSHGANFPITDFGSLVNRRVIIRNLTSTQTSVTLTVTLLYVRNVGGVIRKVLSSICDTLSAKGVVVC